MCLLLYGKKIRFHRDRGSGSDKKHWRGFQWFEYVEDHAEYGSSLEDEETIAKILESQANDENAVDENGKLIGQPDEPQQPVSSEVAADQSIDKLRDFEYL